MTCEAAGCEPVAIPSNERLLHQGQIDEGEKKLEERRLDRLLGAHRCSVGDSRRGSTFRGMIGFYDKNFM